MFHIPFSGTDTKHIKVHPFKKVNKYQLSSKTYVYTGRLKCMRVCTDTQIFCSKRERVNQNSGPF